MNPALARAGAHPFLGFGTRALGLSIGLFGLLRLAWVENHLLWPFTSVQASLAAWGGGGAETFSRVGLNCSGADAIALCLAFILAWPARWSARIPAAAVGLLFIVSVNVVRIMTLVRLEPSPWFTLLHEYLWPAILTLASAGYVFGWMWWSDRRSRSDRRGPMAGISARQPWTAFAVSTVICVTIFFATVPMFLETAPVLTLAGWMASAAATLVVWFGGVATATGPVLMTARGGFLVTGECIATPVIPVGVAAALAIPTTWYGRGVALVMAVPLFLAFGIVRLLVLALPSSIVDAPDFWAHAFFQILLGLVVVSLAVIWRQNRTADPWSRAGGRALTSIAAGLIVAVLLGLQYAEVVQAAGVTLASPFVGQQPVGLVSASDPQRALALLPAFQVGLFIALAVGVATGWRATRLAVALALLALSQVLLFAAVHSVMALGGPAVPVPGVRFWAVAGPVCLLLVYGRGFTNVPSSTGYQDFWEGVGREFPDLSGAASTNYYRENEIRLLTAYFPAVDGITLLKTDLWDEAKNTRILEWAARRGAHAFGIDIARSTILQAKLAFTDRPLHAAAADVRRLPFTDEQFDAIYSMGTIEHFDDSDAAVQEMFRVLKPGGRAIVGVPNRWDPFLRPLLVRLMQYVGVYGYGAERSFSRHALRRMLESHGFQVMAETGILFIPGWLRMLDLACHAYCRPLTVVTRALVAPFVYLDRRVAWLRRHGYLLATVVTRPGVTAAPHR